MTARILIVGCGAIGGLFASALSSVADVIAYDANAEHVRAINEQGLRITGKSPRVARITATDDATALKGQSFDAIFFLTKSKATGEALRQLQPLIAGTPLLVTLQNGMGNAEVLLSAPGPVVRGVTMNAGRYIEPGAIENHLTPAPGSHRINVGLIERRRFGRDDGSLWRRRPGGGAPPRQRRQIGEGFCPAPYH